MKLFDPISLGAMQLKNRVVRSATHSGLADAQGRVTSKLVDLLARVVRGGAGLAVTDYANVLKESQAAPCQLGVFEDGQIPGLRELVKAVHDAGGTIALQLVHGGAHSRPDLTGVPAAGPTELPNDGAPLCRAMTPEEIEALPACFARAAVRARQAGFDGVQIHAAHGYLLSQFLSPFYNRRTDRYGGSIGNRARLLLEVYREVRSAVGPDYPVLAKVNTTDLIDDGLRTEEGLQAAVMLAEAGIDAIELSGGTAWAMRILHDMDRTAWRTIKSEAYYRDAAIGLKRRSSVPVILTGGMRRFETAEEVIEQGVADCIGLCRPLIREPDLVKRWEKGDRRPAACLSDNACFGPLKAGRGLVCPHASL